MKCMKPRRVKFINILHSVKWSDWKIKKEKEKDLEHANNIDSKMSETKNIYLRN